MQYSTPHVKIAPPPPPPNIYKNINNTLEMSVLD